MFQQSKKTFSGKYVEIIQYLSMYLSVYLIVYFVMLVLSDFLILL